jgi:hypothetical protein
MYFIWIANLSQTKHISEDAVVSNTISSFFLPNFLQNFIQYHLLKNKIFIKHTDKESSTYQKRKIPDTSHTHYELSE